VTKNIVVIGSSNTDMIIRMPRIPQPGETILGGTFSTAPGGKGANQAVAAARAGGNVTFVARVGRDMFGDQAVQGFEQDGIQIKYIVKDSDAPSGVAMIFVDEKGENSIAVASGANMNLSAEDIQNAADTIASADTVLMQLEIPLETVQAAAGIAANNNVKVILNPAPAQTLPDELLQRVTILTPNESEAENLTGIKVETEAQAADAARALQAKGIETVIITLGARGAYVLSADYEGLIPSFTVTAVDSTAAGDIFNGVLAVALAEGTPIPDAVRFASAAAALSVTKLGAQPSAPRRQEIETFMSEKI
jgi:ribokinase